MHGRVYDFSSTQVNLPFSLAKEIIAWGEGVVSDSIIFKNGELYGREDEIHITLLYGLLRDNLEEVEKVISKFSSFDIILDKVSAFHTNPRFDVLKIDVISQELLDLNQYLRKKFKHINRFPVYQPHITIAYVQKYFDLKFDPMVFYGKTVNVQEVIFSAKNGLKTPIQLKKVC